jgi:hypothetical protein
MSQKDVPALAKNLSLLTKSKQSGQASSASSGEPLDVLMLGLLFSLLGGPESWPGLGPPSAWLRALEVSESGSFG